MGAKPICYLGKAAKNHHKVAHQPIIYGDCHAACAHPETHIEHVCCLLSELIKLGLESCEPCELLREQEDMLQPYLSFIGLR